MPEIIEAAKLPIPITPPTPPVDPTALPEAAKVEDDKLGQKFAALSRKEKEILTKQEQVKAEKAEVEKARLELADWKKQREDFEALKKMNPLKAMKQLGYRYQDIADAQLNDEEPGADFQAKTALSEIEQLRKELADKDAKAVEDQKKALDLSNQRAKENWQMEVKGFIEDKAQDEVCELIRTNESQKLMEETIEAYYTQNGKILNYKEAAEMTEKFIETQIEKNLSTKKGRAIAERILGITPKVEDKKQEPTTKSRTLNNSLTPSTPIAPKKAFRSEEERIKAAMKKLEDWEKARGQTA